MNKLDKMKMDRDFIIPKNAVPVPAPDGLDVAAYVYDLPRGRAAALAFSGKRGKPDFHYSYGSLDAARAKVADYFSSAAASAKARADYAAARKADKAVSLAGVYAKARRSNSLSAADVAIVLRAVLARKYPGVKFSVRSKSYAGGSSVDVSYVDGPPAADVNDLVSNYSFKGFDGMIDMAFGKSRWMAPDGSMSLASSDGSSGSRGVYDPAVGSPHHPGAVLVNHGPGYVHASRAISPAVKLRLARELAAKYGVAMPADFPGPHDLERFLNGAFVPGGNEWMSSLVNRAANEEAAGAASVK